MGIETFGENERAAGQKEDALKEGYHFDSLFDQNEDESGEKINLANGNEIRNDEGIQTTHGMVIDRKGKLTEIKKELENDPATKWLLEHGYDEAGNKKISTEEEELEKAA